MEFLILFVTGLSVGIVSAFFGIGGGAIMIPVLYALFPALPPASIISISLGTIVLNTALNNWNFRKAGIGPSQRNLIVILNCSFVGALIGSQVLYLMDASTLKRILGVILLFMALRVAFHKAPKETKSLDPEKRSLSIGITCLVGSFVSSITGLGGGAIFVPLFIGFVKLPLKKVSPFSNASMTAASFVGLVPHLFKEGSFELKSKLAESSFIGHVNLLFIICLLLGAFATSRLGAKLHDKASDKTRKYSLVGLLLVLSVRILWP